MGRIEGAPLVLGDLRRYCRWGPADIAGRRPRSLGLVKSGWRSGAPLFIEKDTTPWPQIEVTKSLRWDVRWATSMTILWLASLAPSPPMSANNSIQYILSGSRRRRLRRLQC